MRPIGPFIQYSLHPAEKTSASQDAMMHSGNISVVFVTFHHWYKFVVGVFIARGKEDALVTKNMVNGESVYGEKRVAVEVRFDDLGFLRASFRTLKSISFPWRCEKWG